MLASESDLMTRHGLLGLVGVACCLSSRVGELDDDRAFRRRTDIGDKFFWCVMTSRKFWYSTRSAAGLAVLWAVNSGGLCATMTSQHSVAMWSAFGERHGLLRYLGEQNNGRDRIFKLR